MNNGVDVSNLTCWYTSEELGKMDEETRKKIWEAKAEKKGKKCQATEVSTRISSIETYLQSLTGASVVTSPENNAGGDDQSKKNRSTGVSSLTSHGTCFGNGAYQNIPAFVPKHPPENL